MDGMQGRFFNNIFSLLKIWTQYTATNETTEISDAKVNVDNKPTPGTCYKIKMAGSKSGANAAFTVTLVLGSTTVLTLTSDDATAVDWVADIELLITSVKAQKVMGTLILNTADPDADYAATTVDLSAGGQLVPKITSGHASDTVTCEMCIVDYRPGAEDSI